MFSEGKMALQVEPLSMERFMKGCLNNAFSEMASTNGIIMLEGSLVTFAFPIDPSLSLSLSGG